MSQLPSEQPLICIVGPTASGKSAVADFLATLVDGEIISADSMQIYTGMDIGTGKLSPSQRSVPYWGLDLLEPGEPYSVALYQRYARQAIADIRSRGRLPIVCGGTGFYVRAIIDEFDFPEGEQQGNECREHYTRLAETEGKDTVWNVLQAVDARSAAAIHPNNVRRVIRALELHEQGLSYADQLERFSRLPSALPAQQFGLSVEPSLLRNRIDARVNAMLAEGLIDEVKRLLSQGFREGLTAKQAIGYKEIVAALEGACSFDEAIERIKIATHRYAKRQRSWFKRDERICWLQADQSTAQDLAEQIYDKMS